MVGSTAQTQYKVSVTESAGFNIGIVNFGAMGSENWTWTSSASVENTTGDSQSAGATVVCPSSNYQGPTIMSIYGDTLFGSFLFYPTTLGSGDIIFLQ